MDEDRQIHEEKKGESLFLPNSPSRFPDCNYNEDLDELNRRLGKLSLEIERLKKEKKIVLRKMFELVGPSSFPTSSPGVDPVTGLSTNPPPPKEQFAQNADEILVSDEEIEECVSEERSESQGEKTNNYQTPKKVKDSARFTLSSEKLKRALSRTKNIQLDEVYSGNNKIGVVRRFDGTELINLKSGQKVDSINKLLSEVGEGGKSASEARYNQVKFKSSKDKHIEKTLGQIREEERREEERRDKQK